eukprot:scaffold39753_cov191-Amphora_coffeaeformis.AAC.1
MALHHTDTMIRRIQVRNLLWFTTNGGRRGKMSAPCNFIVRGASGNHCSQQMATPTLRTFVGKAFDPDFPEEK